MLFLECSLDCSFDFGPVWVSGTRLFGQCCFGPPRIWPHPTPQHLPLTSLHPNPWALPVGSVHHEWTVWIFFMFLPPFGFLEKHSFDSDPMLPKSFHPRKIHPFLYPTQCHKSLQQLPWCLLIFGWDTKFLMCLPPANSFGQASCHLAALTPGLGSFSPRVSQIWVSREHIHVYMCNLSGWHFVFITRWWPFCSRIRKKWIIVAKLAQ